MKYNPLAKSCQLPIVKWPVSSEQYFGMWKWYEIQILTKRTTYGLWNLKHSLSGPLWKECIDSWYIPWHFNFEYLEVMLRILVCHPVVWYCRAPFYFLVSYFRLRISDLANGNMGHPVKSEFKKNNTFFLVYVPYHMSTLYLS